MNIFRMNKKLSVSQFVTQSGLIAAFYVALSLLSEAFGLSAGPVQFRLSEVLTVLPIFTYAAIPGLFVGCVISNLLSGCVILDVVFGSIVTLVAAILTYMLRKFKILPLLPPIVLNAFIIPIIFKYCYMLNDAYYYMVLTVGLGEIVTCGVLGFLLRKALSKFER